jgi:hypothetical protein
MPRNRPLPFNLQHPSNTPAAAGSIPNRFTAIKTRVL